MQSMQSRVGMTGLRLRLLRYIVAVEYGAAIEDCLFLRAMCESRKTVMHDTADIS